jgi:hypothetical protein
MSSAARLRHSLEANPSLKCSGSFFNPDHSWMHSLDGYRFTCSNHTRASRHESVMPVFSSGSRDGLILLREAESPVHQALRSEVPASVIGTRPAVSCFELSLDAQELNGSQRSVNMGGAPFQPRTIRLACPAPARLKLCIVDAADKFADHTASDSVMQYAAQASA